MIHLDKALARIREYERMKLKVDFNPFDAAASGSEASNAARPSANPAGVEGTRPQRGCKDVYPCAIIHRPSLHPPSPQVLQHPNKMFAVCVR